MALLIITIIFLIVFIFSYKKYRNDLKNITDEKDRVNKIQLFTFTWIIILLITIFSYFIFCYCTGLPLIPSIF